MFVAGPKTIFFWAPAFKWVSDCVKNAYLYQGWCYLCYIVSQSRIPQPKCSCHSLHRIVLVSVISKMSYQTCGNASEVYSSSSPCIMWIMLFHRALLLLDWGTLLVRLRRSVSHSLLLLVLLGLCGHATLWLSYPRTTVCSVWMYSWH